MGKLFGTDGVRGVANKDLTADLAFKLGRAGAYVLTKTKKHEAKILVGMDTRISGDMLESALIAGICSVGAHAISAGIIPTPAVAYLVRKYNLDAGVVISASHNPVEDNGIKFFNGDGYKLSDDLENEIENIIQNDMDSIPSPTGIKIGTKQICEEALNDYIELLKGTTTEKFDGITVAIDCANGASYKAAPIALMELGANVRVIHNEPDGTNINNNCGSTHIQDLIDFVKESKADVGFAFDGDADRCLAVDENGDLIDGDQIIAICGINMKAKNKLTNNTIVSTIMSNLGLLMMGQKNDINIEQTKVGDRYVLERMLQKNYNLGGEQSGHVIFLDYNTTGDGIITAIQVLTAIKKSGKKLSELKNVMEVLPQVLVNAKVDNSKKNLYTADEQIKEAIQKLENKFSGEGRVLIRPSGTEPVIRVMIEGKDKDILQKAADALAALIESRLS